MTDKEKATVNKFFVRVFNQILSWEEQSFREMGLEKLSLRELHVIEAVYYLMEKDKNKMSEIASYLAITPGSLTTSVNCLVKKGYLERENDPDDRRVVKIVPTSMAEEANKIHQKFHMEMIDKVFASLDEKSIDVLSASLYQLDNIFGNDKRR